MRTRELAFRYLTGARPSENSCLWQCFLFDLRLAKRLLWREALSVRKLQLVAALIGVGVIVIGGSSLSGATPSGRHTITEAAVCKAFTLAAIPVPWHLTLRFQAVEKVAERAKNTDIRRAGRALLKDHEAVTIEEGSKPWYQIGSICVAKGLTPKDWAESA
jgi:hypothetical protein